MRRWLSIAPGVLLVAGGCLASKSDIRLLQDELRATRAQLASGDTALLRSGEARRLQIDALSAKVDRAMDSLRTVANRLASFQATTNGEFDSINQQMTAMRSLLGQATRNAQDAKAQIQALREQGLSPAAPGGASDSSRAAPGVPGPNTLYNDALESLNSGAYGTARRGFEQLLTSYPTFEQASRALLRVGDTYKMERNFAAADSVYRLVADRYPKSDEAATGLYYHGKKLWDENKKAEARVALTRVTRDYPNSDAAVLAKELLNARE